MSSKLAASFSVSGVSTKPAETLTEAIGTALSAIEPEVPYTIADWNWMNLQQGN